MLEVNQNFYHMFFVYDFIKMVAANSQQKAQKQN